MNKKGLIFDTALFVTILIVFVSAFVILQSKKQEFIGDIGEQQFALIQGYQSVEKDMYYIERILVSQISDNIRKIVDVGGLFYEQTPCGLFGKYLLWSAPDKTFNGVIKCYPFEEKSFEELIKPWIKLPTGISEAPIISLILKSYEGKEFNLKLENNLIKYYYKSDKLVDIYTGKTYSGDTSTKLKLIGDDVPAKYSFYPGIKVEFPYSLSDFEKAKKLADKVIDECADKVSVGQCIFGIELIEDQEFDLIEEEKIKFLDKDCNDVNIADVSGNPSKYGIKGRIVPVCFKSNQMLLDGYANIKFALYIPDKRELGFGDIFSNGVFDFLDIINLNLGGFDILNADVYTLTGANDELSYDYKKVNELTSFTLPLSTSDQFFNIRLHTTEGDFDYRIRVSGTETQIIE